MLAFPLNSTAGRGSRQRFSRNSLLFPCFRLSGPETGLRLTTSTTRQSRCGSQPVTSTMSLRVAPVTPSHQGDDLCALRPAARRGGLALSLSRLGGLLDPALRLRRRLLLAFAVVAHANRGRACGGDLEPDPPPLLVTGPVRLIALDPDLLQKPELGEPNHRSLDGCGSHALRQDRKAVLTLRGRRKDDELGVIELTGVRLRHDVLRCGSWRHPPPPPRPRHSPLGSGVGRASLPLSLSPRLDRAGQDSNALFASQSQSFLQGG